jgi:hypothetical protein
LSSGSGRTSGYPTYEAIPAQFLRDVPISDLVAALESGEAAMLAGGVRLAGRNFRQNRRDDLLALPVALRATLLAFAQGSGDEDKISRVGQAFIVEDPS